MQCVNPSGLIVWQHGHVHLAAMALHADSASCHRHSWTCPSIPSPSTKSIEHLTHAPVHRLASRVPPLPPHLPPRLPDSLPGNFATLSSHSPTSQTLPGLPATPDAATSASACPAKSQPTAPDQPGPSEPTTLGSNHTSPCGYFGGSTASHGSCATQRSDVPEPPGSWGKSQAAHRHFCDSSGFGCVMLHS